MSLETNANCHNHLYPLFFGAVEGLFNRHSMYMYFWFQFKSGSSTFITGDQLIDLLLHQYKRLILLVFSSYWVLKLLGNNTNAVRMYYCTSMLPSQWKITQSNLFFGQCQLTKGLRVVQHKAVDVSFSLLQHKYKY